MKLKKIDGINIVPFIDIMLVLLVIVLTSATFIAQGKIPINLPSANAQSTQQRELKEIEIAISENGEYFYDGEKISLEELSERVSELPKDTPILLRGDKKSAFAQFVALVGILQELNRMNVDIQVMEQ